MKRDFRELFLYEDADVLVIHKPAGVVVNRAESVRGETVQDWMDAYLQLTQASGQEKQRERDHSDSEVSKREQVFLARSGLAHRLDKETSGALVLGKNPDSLANLMRQFKERTVKKQYVALVHGKVTPRNGFIQLPIQRSMYDRHQFQVVPFGKHAFTDYAVAEYIGSDLSLVRLFPKTGRTHQIRVHMKHIGHPLVADELYLGKRMHEQDSAWCPRHFLHAETITFHHPRSGERLTIEAALPTELRAALEQARKAATS